MERWHQWLLKDWISNHHLFRCWWWVFNYEVYIHLKSTKVAIEKQPCWWYLLVSTKNGDFQRLCRFNRVSNGKLKVQDLVRSSTGTGPSISQGQMPGWSLISYKITVKKRKTSLPKQGHPGWLVIDLTEINKKWGLDQPFLDMRFDEIPLLSQPKQQGFRWEHAMNVKCMQMLRWSRIQKLLLLVHVGRQSHINDMVYNVFLYLYTGTTHLYTYTYGYDMYTYIYI